MTAPMSGPGDALTRPDTDSGADSVPSDVLEGVVLEHQGRLVPAPPDDRDDRRVFETLKSLRGYLEPGGWVKQP